MAKHIDFQRGDVLPASWTDAIQEYISTVAANLRLSLSSATTVQIVAGADDAQAAAGIGGRFRWISTTASAVASGGAGTKDVLLVASENEFANTPEPDTDTTNYAFGLQIVATGAGPAGTFDGDPIVASRKVGEVDWSGSAITGLRQTVGAADSTLPITPTAPHATITPVTAVGASSQTAPLMQAGTTLATPTDRMALSAAGQLTLPVTGSAGGLKIGGDATLYRSAANALRTGGSLTVDSTLTASGVVRGAAGSAAAPEFSFTGDTNTGIYSAGADLLGFSTAGSLSATINAAGQLALPTSGTAGGLLVGGDANLYRSAAGALRTSGTLIVDGTMNAGVVTAQQATVAQTATAGGQRSIRGDLTIANATHTGGAGVIGMGFASHTTGTLVQLYATQGYLTFSGAGGSVTTIAALAGKLNFAGVNASGAITNAYGLIIDGPDNNTSGTVTTTIDTSAGVYVGNQAVAALPQSKVYGIFVAAQGAGTSETAGIRFAAGTTVASGIQWGADVTLYRSAATTLRTNSLFYAPQVGVNGTPGATDLLYVAGNATRYFSVSSLGKTYARFDDNTPSTGALFVQNLMNDDGAGTAIIGQLSPDGGTTVVTAGSIRFLRDATPWTTTASTQDGKISFYTATDGSLGAAVLTLRSSGRAEFATTGPSGGLLIGGDAALYRSAASTLRTSGSLIVDGTTTFTGNTVSDVTIVKASPILKLEYENAPIGAATSHGLRFVQGSTSGSLANRQGGSITWSSDDAELTTLPGKMTAFLSGRWTESVDADTKGGMALDFGVLANNAGASVEASAVMTLLSAGLVLGGGANINSANARLVLAGTSSAAADGILFGGDVTLYRAAADVLATDDTLRVGSDNFATALTRTMAGLELVGKEGSTAQLYTPPIKFMSTDSSFTTENPKLLALIVGRALETYNLDTRGGMALDFGVSGLVPGASSLPTVMMSLLRSGMIVGGTGTETVAAAQLVLAGDTVTPSGGMRFGSDTTLYRSAASTLKTDGALVVGSAGVAIMGGGVFDAPEAGVVRSVNSLRLRMGVGSGDLTLNRVMQGIELMASGMNTTSKYTAALKFMTTDGNLTTENPKFLAAVVGRALRTYGADTDSGMGVDVAVTTGSMGATVVPFVTASFLPDGLVLGNQSNDPTIFTTAPARIVLAGSGTTASDGIRFGGDTYLYRGAANTLKTDGGLMIGGGIGFPSGTNVGSGIQWGTDTNLYRSAASTLKTDSDFVVGSVLTVNGTTLTSVSTGVLELGGGTARVLRIGHSNGTPLGRTMGGLELATTSTQGYVTAAVKFMSTDSDFTTENPKLMAAVMGRAISTYTSDTSSGMAIDIATTVGAMGATVVPVVTASFFGNGLTLGDQANPVTANVANARLVFTGSPTTPAGGIMWGSDTNLYRSTADTLKTDDALHVGAAFRHLGSSVGFFNAAATTQKASPTQAAVGSAPTALTAASTLADVIGVVSRIHNALQAYGLLGSGGAWA